MANAENIQKVISLLEKEESYFNMKDWDRYGDSSIVYPPNVCGTPSCIGGWGEAVMRHESPEIDYWPVSEVATWFGLDEDSGIELFFPEEVPEAYKATKAQAIAHLRHIVDTGEVNWSKFVASEHND